MKTNLVWYSKGFLDDLGDKMAVDSTLLLKQTVEQLEFLAAEKEKLAEQGREILAEAKNNGFDPKVLKQVLRIRKMEPEKVDEEEALLRTYLDALTKAERVHHHVAQLAQGSSS
jgi:uncharacterized protein (UPF0335 family)